MNTTLRRSLKSATASAALAITVLGAVPANAVMPSSTIDPGSVTSGSTPIANSTNKLNIAKVPSVAPKQALNATYAERLWCVTSGEGEYRIRSFKVTYAVHPDNRDRPVPEGSFGFPTFTVVQARVSYCGRTAEGLAEQYVPVNGLRIDIEGTPVNYKGRLVGFGIRRNVVANWSPDPYFFEGPAGRGITSLPPGTYTLAAVSPSAPKATMSYTVAPGPR